MIIEDRHIKEAEELLINRGSFDEEERIPFIKNLDSCDLLAVPGSGKTTALLAKLYCMSKHLPFNDGSGILVLSHTNAAVNEIEKNLKAHSPKLFEYPNFVGTVQSFVNKFLANPACFEKYDSYISINDGDVYEKEAVKYYHSLEWSKKGETPPNLINKLFGRLNIKKNDLSKDEKKENIKSFIKYFELNIIERKIIYNDKSFYTYNGESLKYYLELEQWKESLYKKGILNYRDSFYLGNWYLDNFPVIKSILQQRFKYVFIDEMQDLEKFQIDIIDKIFHKEDLSLVMQRIGDINQSIYNSGKTVKTVADWSPRNQMYLNGSNRLTPEVANIVNCFTLDKQQDEIGNPRFIVEGRRQSKSNIKPHLILFDNSTKCILKDKFKELIQKFSLSETEEGKKYGFKIIGWNARWDDNERHEGKLRLENIFESYKKEAKGSKETFDSLSKYLQLFNHDKNTLEASRKAILNSLIHILRIENKTYSTTIRGKEVSRYYTKDEMIKYIKDESNNCNYELFKSKLFQWSFNLSAHHDYETVYNELKSFIENDFKTWFSLNLAEETKNFIGNQFEAIIINEQYQNSDDKYNQIKIEIDTVHSAKGQTHCATMYVETSYHEYETKKSGIIQSLQKQEHGLDLTNDKDKRGKQALKMMYVGFSRPTHLLCFASLKENIGDTANYSNAGWEIIDLAAR